MSVPARSGGRALLVHLPIAVVLAIVAVGMVRIGQYHWREGSVLIGFALLVAAVLRALLPWQRAGALVIRGPRVDVACYVVLGVLIMYVAFTITGGPFAS